MGLIKHFMSVVLLAWHGGTQTLLHKYPCTVHPAGARAPSPERGLTLLHCSF